MDGQILPDKPSFYQSYKGAIWMALLGGAAVTTALIVYILFIRSSGNGGGIDGDVYLEVAAPQISASGSEISYQVKIKNQSNSNLTRVELEVFYPTGFVFIDSTPDPPSGQADGRKFALNDLAQHSEDSVVIVGRLEGAVEEIKVSGFKLHYVPQNFRSVFVAETSAVTRMLAPDLSFQLTAPAHLVQGQKITYEMRVRNISARPYSEVLIRVKYPEKFEFREADPVASNAGSDEWRFEGFGTGEEQIIRAAGIVSLDPGKEAFVSAELFVPGSGGNLVSVGRSFGFTQITRSPLLLAHRLTESNDTVSIGQDLKYEITYTNTSQVGLNNVVVALEFLNSTADLIKFNASGGQLRGQTVVFIPATVPELLLVDAGEQGKLELRVPVSQNVVTALLKNPAVKTRVLFYSKELPEPIAGNVLEYKVESALAAAGSATFLGNNEYRVDLSVSNGVNDVVEGVLSAVVPIAGVDFRFDTVTPFDEQANLQFVPNAGVVRWDMGRIFAFSGSFHEPRRISFVLRVPSGTFTSGSDLTLLRDIEVSGTDEFTGNKISAKKIEKISSQ